MDTKIYINWNDFHKDVKTLVDKIKASQNVFTKIVAVSRGGLIPAGIIAYELDIRSCDLINMSSYDGDNQRNDSEIELDSHLSELGSDSLIIDDLADSGRTFRMLREKFPLAKFACVYTKPKGSDSADYSAVPLPDNWVVFPWD